MGKCPDCDGVKILFDEGDGKCSRCHGTGGPDIIAALADNINVFPDAEPSKCYVCAGSGVCQTCGGTGVTDD